MRFKPRKHNQESLGEVIDRMLDVYRLRSGLTELSINSEWSTIAGPAIASRTDEVILRGSKLIIRLNSPATEARIKLSAGTDHGECQSIHWQGHRERDLTSMSSASMPSTLSFWERESFSRLDIAIVGGGIVGMSVAASVIERWPDRQVTIIERSSIPYGASTRNVGFACFGSLTEVGSRHSVYGLR